MEERIKLFGRPKLLIRGRQQVKIPPSVWRVLAVIAAQQHASADRTFLLDRVWASKKRSTLRKLLWDVREIERELGVRLLDTDGDEIKIKDSIYCDVRDLLAAIPSEPLSRIYRGTYAEGLSGTTPAWTTWIAGERQRLREIYVARATASLVDSNLSRAEAVREARHLLQVDPGSEAALRVGMLANAVEGDISSVRHGYRALEAHLGVNGSRPTDETRDLYTRLIGANFTTPAMEARGGDPGVPTICILPPMGGSGSGPAWRLARSLVADVTIGMCRHSLIKVIAPHTAAQIRNADEVTAFGTSYLVSIELFEHVVGRDQVIISLLALPEKRVLWSDRIEIADQYTVESYNVLTTGVLRSVLRHVDQAAIDAYALRTEPSSYVDFLLGQSTLTSLDLRDIRRGRQHLRRAVDRSPTFAPAVSALARSYQLEWLLTARGDSELLTRSEHYARAAVAADPYEARGHRELGFCYLYRKHFDRSVDHYLSAERLSPHHADILADHADALVHVGKVDLALETIDRAIELNPLCQDTYYWTRGAANYFRYDYEAAVSSIRAMRDQTPALRLLAAAYALKGDKAEASRCKTKAMVTYPEMTIAQWAPIVPFQDQRQVEHYINGLRQAGFK